jgi:hypothetical protein
MIILIAVMKEHVEKIQKTALSYLLVQLDITVAEMEPVPEN